MDNQAELPPIESLVTCPTCKEEMRLLGIEQSTDIRELYTFECKTCGHIEVRGVRIN